MLDAGSECLLDCRCRCRYDQNQNFHGSTCIRSRPDHHWHCRRWSQTLLLHEKVTIMWTFIKRWWFFAFWIVWGIVLWKARSESPLRTMFDVAVMVIFGIWLIQDIVKRKRSRP